MTQKEFIKKLQELPANKHKFVTEVANQVCLQVIAANITVPEAKDLINEFISCPAWEEQINN